jgi:integrase/recombinase XerC
MENILYSSNNLSILEKSKNELQKAFLSWLANFDSQSTQKTYYTAFFCFPTSGKKKTVLGFFNFLNNNFAIQSITEIDNIHVVAYKNYLVQQELSTSSIRLKLSIISSFFKYLASPQGTNKEALIKHIPVFNNVKVHSQNHKNISLQDAVKILHSINRDTLKGKRDYAIFMLLIHHALRANEIISLRHSNFFSENEKMYLRFLGKGKKESIIELGEDVEQALTDYIQSKPASIDFWVSLSRKICPYCNKVISGSSSRCHHCKTVIIEEIPLNSPLTKIGLQKIIKSYAKSVLNRTDISPHAFRALSACLAYDATNNDILATRDHLRHSNIETTSVYLQKLTGRKKNVVSGYITREIQNAC